MLIFFFHTTSNSHATGCPLEHSRLEGRFPVTLLLSFSFVFHSGTDGQRKARLVHMSFVALSSLSGARDRV